MQAFADASIKDNKFKRPLQSLHLKLLAKPLMQNAKNSTLVKPAAVVMVKTLGGADIVKKVKSVPLSDTTIQRKVYPTLENILSQLIVELKNARIFFLQANELAGHFR